MDFLERHFITNELTRKRYRRFKQDRLAVISLYILIILLIVSATAEFWAYSKPHIMKYHGKIYAPLFFTYHPSVFGVENQFVTNYRKLKFENGDWAIWPIIQ